MALKINHITFDCHEPLEISTFWAAAMGWHEDPDDPNLPEQDVAMLLSPDGSQSLLFIQVPEGKTVKNRVHLDIAPTDTVRDVEVERLISLGATVYADLREPDGTGWVTMQDPEGNEFCVVRSDAERTEENTEDNPEDNS
jgi:predicted enzyme related to lactoylglutathione lyase